MSKWYGVEAVRLSEWMLRAINAMSVEFLLKQCIYRRVEVKRESRWPCHAQFIVSVKTALTLHEEVNFRARQRPFGAAVAIVWVAIWFIVLAHIRAIVQEWSLST